MRYRRRVVGRSLLVAEVLGDIRDVGLREVLDHVLHCPVLPPAALVGLNLREEILRRQSGEARLVGPVLAATFALRAVALCAACDPLLQRTPRRRICCVAVLPKCNECKSAHRYGPSTGVAAALSSPFFHWRE